MTKSAADVEREVEASRGSLDRTVEALRDKMTPGQLFDEATRAMGGAGQQVASKFLEQAKENPMPLAVMGLGLAWLMTSNRNGGHTRPANGGYANEYERRAFTPEPGSQSLGSAAHAATDKASDLVSGARDKLSELGGSAAEGAQRVAHELGDRASAAGDQASRYVRSAQRSFSELLQSEPLLLGAAGLLVGAAIGAALPPTEAEDKLVGGMRDDLLDKGKSFAQTGMQRAGDVAHAAYDSLKSELQQSADGADPAERAESAVRNAVQAGRDQLQGPPN